MTFDPSFSTAPPAPGLSVTFAAADVDVLAGSRADGQILAQIQRHVSVLRRDSLDRSHRPDRDAVQVVEEQRALEIGRQRGDVVVGSVQPGLDACPQTQRGGVQARGSRLIDTVCDIELDRLAGRCDLTTQVRSDGRDIERRARIGHDHVAQVSGTRAALLLDVSRRSLNGQNSRCVRK